ncbi:MAG: hypothetical protein ACM31E_07715 [Fibrobacterota bacterium]|nr:hypothetical protein [Chitinispirillaceae bacterium]
MDDRYKVRDAVYYDNNTGLLQMDTLTPARRSWNMSRIKGKDNKPEIFLLFSLTHSHPIASFAASFQRYGGIGSSRRQVMFMG